MHLTVLKIMAIKPLQNTLIILAFFLIEGTLCLPPSNRPRKPLSALDCHFKAIARHQEAMNASSPEDTRMLLKQAIFANARAKVKARRSDNPNPALCILINEHNAHLYAMLHSLTSNIIR